MGVERILVTGADEDLDAFHLAVCLVANPIERRGQTVIYTVMGEDFAGVLEAARRHGMTVQRRVDPPEGSPPEAYWPVVVQGRAAAWTPAAEGAGR